MRNYLATYGSFKNALTRHFIGKYESYLYTCYYDINHIEVGKQYYKDLNTQYFL